MENVNAIAEWGRRDRRLLRQGDASPPRIGRVGIIGAGMMGTSIAAAHVRHHVPVVIHDSDANVLDRARTSIAAELAETDATTEFTRLVCPTADLAEAARCDLVLESIVELLPAKLALYAEMKKHLANRAIVASNTSTIPIERLSSGIGDASRFVGMHFCHPVRQRPLVEIVRGPKTSDLTIARAVAHAIRIDRIPIVVPDGPGFVVNRLLLPYLGEALELLREGATLESVEQAAADFGMAIGPLRLMDEIGLDTTLQAAWVLAAAFPDRVVSSPLLVSLIKAGRLGRKSDAGFFSYNGPSGRATQTPADAAVAKLIAPWVNPIPRASSETLCQRLILPMLLEATRILEEHKVGDVRDIDLAVLFGLGFPVEKGGLLWWADTLGAERIIAMLQSLTTMGPRAEPTAMLRSLARAGDKFYRLAKGASD